MAKIRFDDPLDIFARFFDPAGQSNRKEEEPELGEILPRDLKPTWDIFENEEGIVLRLAVPGMSREDIRISLENELLSLSGERKTPFDDADWKVHRIENFPGTFNKVFRLENGVDKEKISARCENGLLSVFIPLQASRVSNVSEIKVT